MDGRHDDFHERLMEQRIRMLDNSEQPGVEDSFSFSIEPFRATPPTLPRKRVSYTSSDCGVNSPHVLSPAMPVTPDNPQPHLIPSGSREPLTPIRMFIHYRRKSNTGEPKYNRSQPDDPDPHLLHRTRTRQGYQL